jgi:hypothetical protein
MNEVRRTRCVFVGVGGEAFLRSRGPTNALAFHEPSHLIAPDAEALLLCGPGELAPAVNAVVLLEELDQLGSDLVVTLGSLGGRAALRLVVGGGGDLKLLQDRLDSPAKPTG